MSFVEYKLGPDMASRVRKIRESKTLMRFSSCLAAVVLFLVSLFTNRPEMLFVCNIMLVTGLIGWIFKNKLASALAAAGMPMFLYVVILDIQMMSIAAFFHGTILVIAVITFITNIEIIQPKMIIGSTIMLVMYAFSLGVALHGEWGAFYMTMIELPHTTIPFVIVFNMTLCVITWLARKYPGRVKAKTTMMFAALSLVVIFLFNQMGVPAASIANQANWPIIQGLLIGLFACLGLAGLGFYVWYKDST